MTTAPRWKAAPRYVSDDEQIVYGAAIVHTITWDGARTLRMYDDTGAFVASKDVEGLTDEQAAGVAGMRWLLTDGDGKRGRR